MQTFLWSLLLAAISAITFVAYKHPLSFRKKVSPGLLWIISGVALFVSGLFLGSVSALSESLLLHSADKDGKMLSFIAGQLAGDVVFYKTSLIACAISFSYILFLNFLPLFLDLPIEEKNSDIGSGSGG
ncbi:MULTISPECIES: hypothetical protein [Xanthomonas]|uniref:hypothetical protein n=1 Tax=Xanthomonas TaxID=338 RepID=UPI001ADC8339|nr:MULTISPECIES: hypothetical protein [unclassified Xanthomonas]MBO9872834.1 hypothetical protein [Xanthomonas sp. D-93]WNH44945.1 hypothetical protein PG878_00225 [Xanthomonas sp. A6251]